MENVVNSRIISKSPEETRRIARDMAEKLNPGTVFALHGDLGAGKTCFIQGLAQGLGVTEAVSSPTFTLVNEHVGQLPLYHIDLYRINHPDEALAIGIDEYLYGQGITALEWAERISELLPESTIHIRIEQGEHQDDRIINVSREDAVC